MPQMPSIPYASPSMYNPDRGTERLIDLMIRRGDVEARGQAASGEIWGRAVQDVGQIAGQAVAQYGEQKKAQQREALFAQVVQNFDPQNPMAAYRELTARGGFKPQEAAQAVAGVVSFQAMAQKAQQGADPTLDEWQGAVVGLGASEKAMPGFLARHYATLSPVVKRGAELYGPGKLPDNPTPEQLQDITGQVLAAHAEWGTKKPQTPDQIRAEAQARAEGTAAGAPPKVERETLDQQLAAARLAGDQGAIKSILALKAQEAAATRAPNQGAQGTWIEAVGPDGKPILLNSTTGQAKPYPSGVTPKPSARERAVTGAERQALAYYNRAKQATEDITPIEDEVSGSGLVSQFQLQSAPNVLQTEKQKLYRQAQRSFTEARLRKESGAAIPTAEYENDAKTYFAQPGDSKDTIEQKRRARAVVLKGLQFSSGKAYEEFYGEPIPTPSSQKGQDGTAPPGAAPAGPKVYTYNPKTGKLE